MSEGVAGGAAAPTFLARLEAAEKQRAAEAARRSKAEAARRAGLAAVSTGGGNPEDPAAARKRVIADAAVVSEALGRWGVSVEGVDLSKALRSEDLGGERSEDVEAALDEAVRERGDDLMLSERRRAALLAMSGRAKVAGVAAAIRTMQFMDRYRCGSNGWGDVCIQQGAQTCEKTARLVYSTP